MSAPLTVAALHEILHDLTNNWKQFALYLPKIIQSDIETITYENQTLATQKTALYNKWLHVYPNASWDDVVKALENRAVRENAIAQRVKDKYYQLHDKVSPSSVPIISLSGNQYATDEFDEVVTVSEGVVEELNNLHNSFVRLTCDVKTKVKQEVENKNMELSSVTYSLQEERAFPIPSLQSVQTTDELFQAIHPHYNFLNCYLIVRIAVNFLFGTIAKIANEYNEEVVQFMKTKTIKGFQTALLKLYRARAIQPSLNTIVVEIAVPEYWSQQNAWLVRKLIETLFPVKHPDELPWYDIVPGSVIMTFIALEHMTSSLIESSRKKTEFMRLIGVISLKIGDEVVWQREDDDAVLSFEDSLIRATLADNIETVLFILQYTQVDINTRNTNRTLINAYAELNIASFYPTFNRIQTKVEPLLATTSNTNQVQGGIPHDNFLNGRKFASMELPDKELAELTNYIEMVDGHKRLIPVEKLEYPLLKYFPDPFPGSIEVIISLHSVWNTCSVWYVEQLGQLIFTPTLFYQLQWFRVVTSEESVTVCLLVDRKIMNSLKECIGNNERQTLVLGVVNVQIDDTVMIVNDYCDGYTFNEAIKLAEAIGDDEISNLLQQIFLSPVDYEDLITPTDENSNHCFIPHPDSTPLMIACCNDNSQLVQLLLDHNADPNIRNRKDNTALTYSTGSTTIFNMLLDSGAEITGAMMHSACIAGNLKNVETLMQKNCVVKYALIIASRYGHITIVKKFLQAYDADLNDQDDAGCTALEAASKYGHTAVVELFLQAKADSNIQDDKGQTALEAASKYGHTAIVELLLQARADPNSKDNKGRTALKAASRHGHTAVVELLLQAHADSNSKDNKGQTALEAASRHGHTAIVELLLQARADPNSRNNDGRTALEVASRSGHTAVVELLLQAQKNSENQDNQGKTALEAASMFGYTSIVQILLQCRANLNIKDNDVQKALEAASKFNHAAVVKLLLQCHTDPNARDSLEQPLLMIASLLGHAEVVEILLQAGADPTLCDNDGNLALDIAIEKNHTEIINLLCQAMPFS